MDDSGYGYAEVFSLTPKWEYCWLTYTYTTDEDTTAFFNTLGAKGWEFCKEEIIKDRRFAKQYKVLFKRQESIEL